MKKLILFAFIALFWSMATISAQAPQGFNYQCIVRDAANAPVTNQTVTLLFSLRNGDPTGPVAYAESHTISTNDFGLVNLVIGQGTPTSGIFNTVDWASGSKYLKVFVLNGAVATELGTTQLMSVPYALFSGNGGGSVGPQGPAGPQGPIGLTGPAGATGAAGPQGAAGATGPQGSVGLTGPAGAAGTPGVAGPAGPAGATGPQGLIGLTGPTGATGATGVAGPAGSPGATGPQGAIGLTGAAGPQGPAGPPGSSGSYTAGNGISISPGSVITNTGDLNAADDVTNSSTAAGDVSGTFSALSVDKIKGRDIASTAPADQQVIKWNAASNRWEPANDVGGGSGDNWGTQTTQTSAALSGNGTAGNPLTIAQQGAVAGQALKWNGSAWTPQDDATGSGGGTGNSYTGGTGINISGMAPNFVINNTGDADNSITNELQALTLTGNSLSLSSGGGTVTLPAGPQGPIGLTGAAGATGPQGPIGLTGAAGATGPQGPIGLTGAAGATGPQGPIGLTGAAGAPFSLPYSAVVNIGAGMGDVLRIQNNSAATAIAGICNTGLGVYGGSTTDIGGYFESQSGIGGFFGSPSGVALATGAGPVGIGTSTPEAAVRMTISQPRPANPFITNRILKLQDSSPITGSSNSAMEFSGIGTNGKWVVSSGIDDSNPGQSSYNVFYNDGISPFSVIPLRLQGNGRVGIGTTAPGAQLQVDYTPVDLTPNLRLHSPTGDIPRMSYTSGTENSVWRVDAILNDGPGLEASSRFALVYDHNASSSRVPFVVSGAGAVGINSSAPAPYTLRVKSVTSGSFGMFLEGFGVTNGWEISTGGNNLDLYHNSDYRGSFDIATGAYTPVSDRKFKTAIEAVPSLLSKVMQLKPSRYEFKTDIERHKKVFGFIAQEVEPLFPELVYPQQNKRTGETDYTLDYSAFGVLAIKAIQEQQLQIVKLSAENQALQAEIEQLRTMNAAVETRLQRIEASLSLPKTSEK